MIKSKHPILSVAAVLSILFASAGLRAETSANPASDKLLQKIPAETLFVVRVNNFDYTLGQIDQFLAGASPMPMPLSMVARMQLAGALGDPALNNIKTTGSFAVFGIPVPAESTQADSAPGIFIAALLPVTDYNQFVGNNPNCSPPDEKAISKITSKTPAGQTRTTLVTQLGSFALITSPDNYDRLVETAKSMAAPDAPALAGALDAAEAELAVKEPIWAYGNVQLASKIFGPIVLGKIEEMKTTMQNLESSGKSPMGDPAAVMNMYAEIFKTLMKETKSLSIIVNPKPSVLNIRNTISAVPGTDMADMFTADDSTKQDNKLLAYLEDEAAMNAAGKVNKHLWKELYKKGIDLLTTFAGESMTAENIAKMKTLATEGIDCLGGQVACSFSIDPNSKPPFAIKYAVEIKDADKFNRVLDQSAELLNTGGIADFYEALGMKTSYTIKRGIESYKGVSIDSAQLVMKSTEPNSPQGQMIDQMYGDGFNYRWAIVDGLSVWAIGADVNSTIHELIDQAKAGGPEKIPAEVKAALAILPDPDEADFVGTYNYLRLFKWVAAMVPTPMPQMDFPTKSNIALAGKVGNGKMTVDIALPKEHLAEIMTAIQMMMQKMMQQQMQQKPMPQQPAGQNDSGPMGDTQKNPQKSV
ncbi:hypothetical protein ES703_68180 [subsurface metagenome]